jgi:hypothetical protein
LKKRAATEHRYFAHANTGRHQSILVYLTAISVIGTPTLKWKSSAPGEQHIGREQHKVRRGEDDWIMIF